MCSIIVQVTQIILKVPSVVRKEYVENVRVKNTNFSLLSILIQVASFFQQFIFTLQVTFNAIYCFLFIYQISFPELSTRTLPIISLRF